ncbi:hypothetical protein JM18_000585 [Phytophthora kernoviae]|uniref:Methyltransferase type 11 domain-containing protein n=1 Tax=Phytophthora kernoviae TaxID=325452 RepID=A0A8T0MBQ7_9STRA|nr:hypothetical protein JM16_000504 [Phytophthora kernoviae]KAG2533196.1 hypothetical protein JM18_000585 [Phytophthora kernoviae]
MWPSNSRDASLDADAALYTVAYFTSDWNLLRVKYRCRTFKTLCRHFQVTDLPAVVLLDAHGQALSQGSLNALESEMSLSRLGEDNATSSPSTSTCSPWQILGELLNHKQVPGAAWEGLQPLWQVNVDSATSKLPTPLEIDDLELVRMREAALEEFETGNFLPAAMSFVKVLLRYPACETFFAVSCMLRVVALDDSDSVAHTVLRSVYYLDEPDLVTAGYHSILAAHSTTHVRSVHSLATLEGETTTKTAAPAYVAEVFDELAETFEEKLVAHLEYRVPWQLVEALQKLSPSGFIPKGSTSGSEWVVADIGCGTGLCGRLLRPHVKHITGVDLSPLMIEKTRAAGSYDELQTGDIVPFLKSRVDESLDLIISADVWIYVGALEDVFALSARKLCASTGWFAFSVELMPPPQSTTTSPPAGDVAVGFRLAPSGRFQHSLGYIASLAERSGFIIVLQEEISVRKESGEAIPGRIYILQRVKQSK